MRSCRNEKAVFFQKFLPILIVIYLGFGTSLAQPRNYVISSVGDFATGATYQGCVVDSSLSAVILEGDSTQNIALGKPGKFVQPDGELTATQITDGSAADLNHHAYYTGKNWDNTYAEVDLESKRQLFKVIIKYRSDVAAVFAPTGYELYVSLDEVDWTLVSSGQNVFYDAGVLAIRFPQTLAQYVKFVGLKEPGAQPKTLGLGEFEVYSLGPTPEGRFISGIQDLGGRANLGRFTWHLTQPTGTEVSIRFRADSTIINETLTTNSVWDPGETYSDFGADGIDNDSNGDGIKQTNEQWDSGEQDGRYTTGEPFVDNGYRLSRPWFPLGGLTVKDTSGGDLLADGTVRFDTTNNIVIWADTTGMTANGLPPIIVRYTAWSGWTAPMTRDHQFIPIPEPRRFFQYMLTLATINTSTPEVDQLALVYDARLISTAAVASLDTHSAPVLRDTSITYTLDFTFSPADYGVDSIMVFTPAAVHAIRVDLDSVDINDQISSRIESNRFYIIFNHTLHTSGKLDMTFNMVFSEPANILPSVLMSAGSVDNPQRVDESPSGWQIEVAEIPAVSLNLVTIQPNPITPNGDGICDEAHISFYVAKLSEGRPVTIRIYDITGRLVNTILDGIYPATYFGGVSGPAWDGTYSNGKRVLPGIYLCQVRVSSDNGDNVFTQPIVVAY